jgi:alkanesulfonate monooxygenase SsuD/methylene tetrahydromethanopterin reductase-like flavin-dependent oxidoreductase (luciferase family)
LRTARATFRQLNPAESFADHVGEGRLGLNLVVGWNEGEFEMFGVKQREHDVRYDFAQEWLDIVKRAWSGDGEFDFAGQFLQLKGVRAHPKPYGGTRPIIMNAGSSPVGQAFALRNCDAFFVATAGSRTSLDANAKKVAEVKSAAQILGRGIEVYTVGQVICRPSQQEAEDYYRHAIIENADWGAIDGMLAGITPQTIPPEEYAAKRRYFAANAIGACPWALLIASPTISQATPRRDAGSRYAVRQLSPRASLFADEVLPRLTRPGVRVRSIPHLWRRREAPSRWWLP